MEHGYIQIYTGDGKGKTTAALGLCLRACGAGFKVFLGQFMKSGEYSEIKALSRFSDLITVRQYGLGRFVKGLPTDEEIRAARKGLKEVSEAVESGLFDVVILEEANVASAIGLFSVDELLALMAKKPLGVELVLTGRNAHPRLIEAADLVTEMKAVKHYYDRGVTARVGIEK